MISEDASDCPTDEQVAQISDALRARFGDRAFMVAQLQMGSASDQSLATWLRVIAHLRG